MNKEQAAEKYVSMECTVKDDAKVELSGKQVKELCKKDFLAGIKYAEGREWISVETELPEHGEKVDLWLVPADTSLQEHRISWTWEGQDSKDTGISNCKITHWMKVPSPPKQSKP